MRADSALSHLYENEACVAMLKEGGERTVRWSRQDWCFYAEGAAGPEMLPFEEIREWRPASIAF